MSHRKKSNDRKSSPTSSSSSENTFWQTIEQPLRRTSQSSSSSSSTKRVIYPNVPKRTQQSSTNIENDVIQTESTIDIISSAVQTQKSVEYSSITSSSNQNDYTRRALNLITKYTSPQKLQQKSVHRSLSPIESSMSVLSNSQSIYDSKCKRTLSPLDETNQESHETKRIKPFDEDDSDEELSQLLDQRRNKQTLSQNTDKTNSSQPINSSQQRKPTVRKPTVRNLSTSQPKPTISQISPIKSLNENNINNPHEILLIEPDIDIEEDNIIDHEDANLLSKLSQISNTEHNGHTENTPSPIQGSIDNLKQNNLFTPIKSYKSIGSSSHSILRRALENPIDNSSPRSDIDGRRLSTTSSSIFHTPTSSYFRTRTTSNILLTPQSQTKNDCETQISLPLKIDIINKLISNMKMNKTNIIYNPIELSKKLFYQCNSFSLNNKYPILNSLIKKQYLSFGRYEIEINFPINNDKISRIYACDICLKHFYGSSIASQRHAAKCLYSQPPGKLVFNENDLAIFQIGETKMNIEQRIYIKSLCRISRLFIHTNKSIDDTKIDRFAYYILCRREPILSQLQSSCYHLIGYFSKPLNQYPQHSINNLSCLFILPPFAQYHEYNQLLIAFSYYLIRLNTSTNPMYCSPVRPLDNLTLHTFQIYWRDIISAYINNHEHSLIKTISLPTIAQQTSIHPRDILSCLYYNGFIISHPTDKSCVFLLKNALHLMTSFKLYFNNKLLYMNTELINIDNDKNKIIDKQNSDKQYDNDIEEIILD